MAEIMPRTSYALTLTEREYGLVAKGLALVSGVKVSIEPEERVEAAKLNATLLSATANELRQKLEMVDRKIEKISVEKT